ncbi:MAG TPA: hypothetical protein VFN61_02750, partial [Acidimicrobiales bacterium]|nr:hypothetical protein [Acidimicrobiales bacterium]
LTSAGGPAYHDPSVSITLPAGETFSNPLPSEPGWSCSYTTTSVNCQSTDPAPIAAGNSIGSITATVNISSGADGPLTTDASMTDSTDAATAFQTTATVNATATPVLGFTTSGTPVTAQSGSNYQVTFNASVSSGGGPTYNGLTMTVRLPAGETFGSAPTVTGWTCAVSGNNDVLTCTTTSNSIAAGTSLGAVTAKVDIGDVSGALTTSATLSDTSDAATPVTLTPTVNVATPTTNPGIFPPPSPPILVIAPATTTTTTTPSSTTTTTLPKGGTTTTTPGKGGTTTTTVPGATTTTLPGGDGAIPLPGGNPPILQLIASAPKSVAAGGKFVIKVATGLSPKGGTAYTSPSFSVDVPAGTTWDQAPVKSPNWLCTASALANVLVCVWQGNIPLAPGSPMGTVQATVDVSATAAGTLLVPVTLSDTADSAKTVTAVLKIAVLAPPGRPGKDLRKREARGRSGSGPGRIPLPRSGYRLVARGGGVFAFGLAKFRGSCQTKTHPCGRHIAQIAGISTAPRSLGYWLVSSNGSVYSFGGAHFNGSCLEPKRPCGRLRSPVTGIAPTPDGRGYWLAAANGAVFSFGDAKSFGSCTATPKLCPGKRDSVVGIAATPDGKGYWLATLDGEVFSFGDAPRKLTCTTSAKQCAHLFGEIAGIAPSPRSKGYWLVNHKGRVFAFGSAHFWGDTYSERKHRPLPGQVVGIAPTGSGNGYWIGSSGGYVMTVEGAGFAGDIGTAKIKKLNTPIVGLAAT